MSRLTPVAQIPIILEDEDIEVKKIYNVGEDNPRAKLNIGQVERIKYLLYKGFRICDIARASVVSWQTIADIRDGKIWKHVVLEQDLDYSCSACGGYVTEEDLCKNKYCMLYNQRVCVI